MNPIRFVKAEVLWRSPRRSYDHDPKTPVGEMGWTWCAPHVAPVVMTTLGLVLAVLMVDISAALGAEPPSVPAETCPCPEMTTANILATGADGGCVDVPPAVTFTRESNDSVYIASRHLCTVSDPPNRKVEWITIKTSGEFETCRRVILTAADKLGVPCTDTYHPTPSRDRTFGSPGS